MDGDRLLFDPLGHMAAESSRPPPTPEHSSQRPQAHERQGQQSRSRRKSSRQGVGDRRGKSKKNRKHSSSQRDNSKTKDEVVGGSGDGRQAREQQRDGGAREQGGVPSHGTEQQQQQQQNAGQQIKDSHRSGAQHALRAEQHEQRQMPPQQQPEQGNSRRSSASFPKVLRAGGTMGRSAAKGVQSFASSLFSRTPGRRTGSWSRTASSDAGASSSQRKGTPRSGRRRKAPIHGVIFLHIGGTRDLSVREVADFVVGMYLDDQLKATTTVKTNTAQPAWNEEFSIEWSTSDAPLFLELRLHDQGRLSGDTLLGLVRIPVGVKQKLRRTEWAQFRPLRNGRIDVSGASIKLDFTVNNPKGISETDYARFRHFCRQHRFDLPILLDSPAEGEDSAVRDDGCTVGFLPGPDEEIEVWKDDVFVAVGQRQARGTVILTNYRLVVMEQLLEKRSARKGRGLQLLMDSVSDEDAVVVSTRAAWLAQQQQQQQQQLARVANQEHAQAAEQEVTSEPAADQRQTSSEVQSMLSFEGCTMYSSDNNDDRDDDDDDDDDGGSGGGGVTSGASSRRDSQSNVLNNSDDDDDDGAGGGDTGTNTPTLVDRESNDGGGGGGDTGVLFLGNELSLNMCVPLGLLQSVSITDDVIYQPTRDNDNDSTGDAIAVVGASDVQVHTGGGGRNNGATNGGGGDDDDDVDDDGNSAVSSNLTELFGKMRSFGSELFGNAGGDGDDGGSEGGRARGTGHRSSSAVAATSSSAAARTATASSATTTATTPAAAVVGRGGDGRVLFSQLQRTDSDSVLSGDDSLFATPPMPGSPITPTRAQSGWGGDESEAATPLSPPKRQQAGFTFRIQCKDMRTLAITFAAGRSGSRRNVQNLITMFGRRLEDAMGSSTEVMALHRGRTSRTRDWSLYNPTAEFRRQGIYDDSGDHPHPHPWTTTRMNEAYTVCPTYPSMLYVPRAIPESVLRGSAVFRSSQRLPVLTWYSNRNGGARAIIRCAQPLVGAVARKSDDDIALVSQLRKMGSNPDHIVICDARSLLAAGGNRVLGKGSEDPSVYPHIKMYFMSIGNIHAVRQSYEALQDLCARGSEKKWYGKLEATGWLAHTRSILSAARVIARKVEQLGVSAIVHCSDGWDRTSQLVALAQIMLDPFFRTLDGFIVLIEKDWLSFGHKFRARVGSRDQPAENSPIFLQFLDCVWQFVRQAPNAFEFTGDLLLFLADHCQSGWFGTFCYDCEAQRIRNSLSQRSASVWSHVAACRQHYTNSNYTRTATVIFPSCSMKRIVLWEDYFLRYDSTRTEDILEEEEPTTFMWVDDKHARVCKDCGLGFTVFRRRHHCRACGHVFCHTCSNRWMELPQHGFKGKQRVCESCYQRMITS
ncbi:hypothetical protein PTSG_10018 [Salpingoeca rosetta]|uniref:phosphatidylinositol-3,5-bisphosphate 3-phosphatase n=1 Tax=Salpingoeca rosetta (strain ATCC 50818 / BSB-021) TaxID=946362 RepID=F2UP97_SALR5|nr:uncharacterized protein PTSG_10018 [Salpingoeca rosetta]EGD79452.1 hypothetical protein PTSG_10018 [Salpingoeca rosetta]|eukprot:XP_004988933.1 hypothetical protein PTSG_10018 [Salpingoeca rosetta]